MSGLKPKSISKTGAKKIIANDNNRKDAKQKGEVVVISSSSADSDHELEEEAKSSNNSNQTLDDNLRKDRKIVSNGGGGGGFCCFPANRIRKIIKSEEAGFRSTQEAMFLINKATEQFLEMFAEDAYILARKDHPKAVSYGHLSSIVCKGRRYDFLSDFVPEKVRAEDALSERLAET